DFEPAARSRVHADGDRQVSCHMLHHHVVVEWRIDRVRRLQAVLPRRYKRIVWHLLGAALRDQLCDYFIDEASLFPREHSFSPAWKICDEGAREHKVALALDLDLPNENGIGQASR